jgi:hypothetical protein
MIFLNKLIKNLFLISTLILNIKAAILNITLPNGTLKIFNDYDRDSIFIKDLIEYINLKIPLNDDSRITDDWKNYCTIIDNKVEKSRINIENSKTYDIKIVEKHTYYINFTNPLDSNYNNKQLSVLNYDLTFSEFLEEVWKEMSSLDRSIESIEYFKLCDGKLYELIDESTDNKVEINDLENFIFDHNKKYLLYFPININDECEIRLFSYYSDDFDNKKYEPNFYIPKNKTLKDMVIFYLTMYNLNKDNVKYYRKSKKYKKVHIYLKKGVEEKYKHLTPEEEEHLKRSKSYIVDHGCDCLGDCIKCCGKCCVSCCSRCKDGLKKVKYEDL